MKKCKLLLAIVVIASLLTLWNPLGFTFKQQMLTGTLLMVVPFWATNVIHKSYSCGILLLSYFLFGSTPQEQIYQFVWSDTNLLIISTTLLSVGMMKTGVVHRVVESLLKYCAKRMLLLLILPYILGIALVFVIPQAFARVIILGVILDGLLIAKKAGQERVKAILIFNAFVGVSVAYMLFSNGDIVLNVSAITFAGKELGAHFTFLNWFLWMAIPVLVTAVLTIMLTRLLFKKELEQFSVDMITQTTQHNQHISRHVQIGSIVIMAGVIASWMSQHIHHIQPWVFATIAVVVLYAFKVLEYKDLSSVNVHFILFLLTVFNIGKVLGQSGVTKIVFEHLQQLIPQNQSIFYSIIIVFVIMILHLCIGSSVATMSVVLPILIPLMESAGYSGIIVVLMTYVIVNIHFMLPFHHAVMMMGIGKSYYTEKDLLRYGSVMTFVTPILILGVYFGWWSLLGLI
ncbi:MULTISPECIES: SLC13 family permease [unclassified Granulicatella]|uniref:SLC13 family permease n=1 Tax=unclassified Granulicatella TaxID=2630493 RepID=UPI001074199C|nr:MULTISPECIES: SLC13 family permease [unclassified Granulicatella]MBF0781060.1 anion permease [Granulicatella sp. 19428wC4_WM01]TFU92260.1 hypothetical protein E4T68_08085 [Granulicatella sp. WM01]